MYSAIVKYNGNHYYAGEEVKGSKVKMEYDGSTWLFDDEPIEGMPYYGDGNNIWVEVEEKSIVDDFDDGFLMAGGNR